MRNIKLTVSYDGTAYHGFQDQGDGLPTIQATLEEAIEKLIKERLRVTGAGRTDAGVHALGQVVNMRTTASIPVERWAHALNAVLPRDIVVCEAHSVPLEFHARFSPSRKTYCYTIDNDYFPCVFTRKYAYHVRKPLDLSRMALAAESLQGRHDFSAFRSLGSGDGSGVRTLHELSVHREGNFVRITACADGFLYNMMRTVAGTLLEVGKGKRPPEWVEEVLASRRRELAGETLPGLGLCLLRVDYTKHGGIRDDTEQP